MTKIRVKRGLSENLDSVSIEGEKMNKIKFRRGSLNNKKNIDIEDGEPIYLTDTKRLYVSNEDVAINNVYVGSQEPNDPGINVWIDPQGVNNVIDMMYPIGSIYISATNTDPSSTFGGTWELIDKEFKSYASSSNDFFNANSTNCELNSCYYTRSGHLIQMRLNYTNKVSLGDTNLTLGTFDFDELGVTAFPYSLYNLIGATDGGNALLTTYINYSTGILAHAESTSTVAANNSCYLLFEVVLTYDRMLDSFCDKFYWKRVS